MRANKRQRPDLQSKQEFRVNKKIKTEKDDLSFEAEDDYGEELSRENDSCMQSSANSGNTPVKNEFDQDPYYESSPFFT